MNLTFNKVPKIGKRLIGIAKGDVFCADDYDFDEEDAEITALFEKLTEPPWREPHDKRNQGTA